MRVCAHGVVSVSCACSLLRRAVESGSLSDGRHVHDQLIRSGHDTHSLIVNSLITMYGQCGSAQEAQSAFNRVSIPTLLSWNVLLQAYGVNGLLKDACSVFLEMPLRDVVSWTAFISLLGQQGHASEALHFYEQMRVEGFCPNKITFLAALNACARACAHTDGLAFHMAVIEAQFAHDVVIGTALIKMYGECGKPELAWRVFGNMPSRDTIAWNAMTAVFARAGDLTNAVCIFRMAPERNTASWNTMIGAYMQNGNAEMALRTFYDMDRQGANPSLITFVCAVNACAGIFSLGDGRMLHVLLVKLGFEEGPEVENALISMYGKCNSMREAESVFGNMRIRDVISWTAIIVACTENEEIEQAFGYIHEMQREVIQGDEISFSCSLDACAMWSTLGEGQRLDDLVNKLGLDRHSMVKTALIDMYGKCGSLQEARHIFGRSSPHESVVVWNAVMTTLAHNGLAEEVFDLLYTMQRDLIIPNRVTFNCVLTVCSHAGWVDIASQFFASMGRDCGMTYTEEHYLCIVDIFARSGQLDQAEVLIKSFPFEKDEGLAWQCLFAACKLHHEQD